MAAVDALVDFYLLQYKLAVETGFRMDAKARVKAFGSDKGIITLINELSPTEFITKIEEYNNPPKTGDIFADSFNVNITRKVLWSDENRVNYIFYDETGDKWVDSSSIDYFKGHNKKISETTEDFNKLFSELSKGSKD